LRKKRGINIHGRYSSKGIGTRVVLAMNGLYLQIYPWVDINIEDKRTSISAEKQEKPKELV